MTVEHPRWEEFCDRLDGPEGCNFREDSDGRMRWDCGGDTSTQLAEEILVRMGNIDRSFDVIHFTVLGRPQTAGSKDAFPFQRKDGSLGVVVTDNNKKGKPHRQTIAQAALEASQNRLHYDEPLVLTVRFIFKYPSKYIRSGKYQGIVKDNAPTHHSTKPDTTKCLRFVEDALNGILWRDDSRVVIQHAEKLYGWPERTEVEVMTLKEAEHAGRNTMQAAMSSEHVDGLR